MPARQHERHAPQDPARRGLLKAAGALGLSSLALAGCASRVAAPADRGEAAPSSRLPMAGLAAGQWRYRLEYERF